MLSLGQHEGNLMTVNLSHGDAVGVTGGEVVTLMVKLSLPESGHYRRHPGGCGCANS